MESFVLRLSSYRLHRDLFWYLAALGPLVLGAFLALLIIPGYRRAVAIGLLVCAAGAIAVTVVFHYTYALAIWERHDSAIRYLDESAFRAGFAASGIVYVLGLLTCAAAARLARRA